MNRKMLITMLAQAALLCAQAQARDYFTEVFNYDFDLNGISLTFTPDEETTNYTVTAESITELPTDVSGASKLNLGDDSVIRIAIPDGDYVTYFGTNYYAMRIGSNGYITFNDSDVDYTPSLTEHFSKTRIALCYRDLDPRVLGKVSAVKYNDRIVVTYEGVPRYGSTNLFCTAQCEMFIDDTIRLSWINTDDMGTTIVGLSDGNGLKPDYVESDLSSYLHPSNDIDEDGLPDTWEALYFGSHANCSPTGHGDADGIDNLREYIAGTDPTVTSSYFHINYGTMQSQPNPGYVLNWNSVAGRTYSVWWKESLTSPAYTRIATGLEYPQNSYTSTLGSAISQGFFKIEVQLAE